VCAVLALLGFIAIYLALTSWFVWTAYRLLSGAFDGGIGDGVALVGGGAMAILSIFMLKALLFRDRREKAAEIEIDAADEPRLFAFLRRIADDAGAPCPHRVFLSKRVNAGVFYDLSIVNLLFPSKKNLDIGLGLINALTLGEVRAVLAHEFGHFSQGAMAVARWVQVAQRVAAHIVHKRDAFDSILHTLSVTDLRVAWAGWIFRLIIWALRAVLDSAFLVVVRAQRTLAHEMERQADLVSVTLTGSDALVHALHKLGAADMAMDQALATAVEHHARGEDIDDVFALQTRTLEHGRRVLADETHGVAPPLPAQGRAAYRLFERRIAHPPRMWSSHPPNREREDNIKGTYVPCDADDRSAWLLFGDADATRARVTAAALAALPKPARAPRKLSHEESLAAIDGVFDHAYFDPRFRGTYLGRSAVRGAETAADLYLPPERARGVSIDELYPANLRDALERWKSLEAEVQALLGLQRGVLQSGSADIQFRGETLRRQDLARTLERVRAECATARAALEEHDREHRSAHLAAAERLGQGWPEYLRSLAALLHYADHTGADLRDARGYAANVVAIAVAGGRVSSGERRSIAAAGYEVHVAMTAAWDRRNDVRLPEAVSKALGVERWSEALPDSYKLAAPHVGNLGEWLKVVDGWLDGFIAPFAALERRVLEALLEAEAKVVAFARGAEAVTPAPAPASTPAKYATLVPGSERERQWRLGWWDRFQTANGFLPSLARFSVAGGLIAATLLLGASVSGSFVVIYNGLGRSVVVDLGSRRRELPALTEATIEGVKDSKLHIVATIADEPLEAFDVTLDRRSRRYVYNVGGAAILRRWTAVYGTGYQPDAEQQLGAPRWSTTDARILFTQPPHTREGGKVPVLSDLGATSVGDAISTLPPEERDRVVRLHATWDESSVVQTDEWIYLASKRPDFAALAAARLAREPHDVVTMRAEQDQPDAIAKAAACTRHARMAEAAPDDADLRYLAIRCRPRDRTRGDAFVAAHDAAPSNPWLAQSAGFVHAERSEWREALACWATARERPGAREQLMIDSARVLRVLGAEREPDVRRLAEQSRYLRNVLLIEQGQNLGGAPLAYQKLHAGALTEALSRVWQGDDERPRILRLLAASRGARAEQVAAARALPADAGIDYHTLWPAIGLAVREKDNAAGLIARMKDFASPEDVPALEEFLHPERLAHDAAAANEALTQLGPAERGHAYVLGITILGDAAPEAWRTEARALLFAPERPFL
jgi:Zn-dependent protease with chaperone function